MIVGLDPGHGGDNHGCVAGGMNETQLTLITALAIRDTMLRRDAGVKVILSREFDESVTFPDRALRLSGADFVLSLHYDSNPDPKVGALMAYCFEGDAAAEAAGKRAEALAPGPLRPPTPGCIHVSRDNWTSRAYNVLMLHRPTPALLVEVGFLSNPRHVEFLRGPGGMENIATVLVDAITVGLAVAAEAAVGVS